MRKADEEVAADDSHVFYDGRIFCSTFNNTRELHSVRFATFVFSNRCCRKQDNA